MKRLALDLSKGLNLTSSDLSVPFKVTRLPFLPLPGTNWGTHPGFDAIDTPEPLQGVTQFKYSDTSGLIIYEKEGSTYVANPSRAIYRQGSIGAKEGAFITGLGLYNSRTPDKYIFLENPAPPVYLSLPEVISGSLSEGLYTIWALSFSRTSVGLFLTWYNQTSLNLVANRGIRIKLAEEPGENRVVNLYVQRDGGKLAFLKALTGGEKEFDYVSHLQEGEYVDLAIPKGTGGLGAYFNGRHFYQASSLRTLGIRVKGSSVGGGGAPDEPLPVTGYAYRAYVDGGKRGFGTLAANSTPSTYNYAGPWKAVVRTSKGVFAAVADEGKIRIMHSDDPNLLGWSLVKEYSGIPDPQCAAANDGRVVFLGGGVAIVGLLDDFFNPQNWSTYNLPATDTPGVVWTGTQFAASVNAPVQGVMTSSDGASWTLSAAGSVAAGYTFHDIIAIGTTLVIQGRQNLSDGFYVDYFSYSGGAWNKFSRKEWVKFSLTDVYAEGVVRRRYTAMFTIKYGGNDYVVVSYGIKNGWYGVGFLSWVDLPESDYHAVYLAQDFLLDRKPVAWEYSPPITNTNVLYNRIGLVPEYATIILSHGGASYTYILNPLQGVSNWSPLSKGSAWRKEITQYTSGNGLVGGVIGSTSQLMLMSGAGFVWVRRWGANGTSTTVVSAPFSAVSPTTDGKSIVWTAAGNLYITNNRFYTRRYALPTVPGSVFDYSVWTDNSNILVGIIYTQGSSAYTAVYRAEATNPSALVQVATVPGTSRVLGVINGKAYIYSLLGIYYAYALDGSGSTAYQLNSPSNVAVATDGTNVYALKGAEIHQLNADGTTTVKHTASGNIGTIFSGSGKVYFTLGNAVWELDTANDTATELFTVTGANQFFLGKKVDNNIVVVNIASGVQNAVYIYDGTMVSTVYEGQGVYSIPDIPPPPPGGGGDEEETPIEESTQETTFPPNTIIWTYPGYVNLTNPNYWHTLTSRTSRTVNEIIAHPSGVLAFMDNETFVLSGRFTSVNDTRVAPYPVQIGVDKDTRVTQAGATLFLVWGGKVYAFGESLDPISYPVDDGVPFKAVAYDAKNNTLFALKENGRLLGYYLPRKVWYDEADGVNDVVQYFDGQNSLVVLLRDDGLYKRFDGVLPSPKYFLPEQTLEIEAVKIGEEDIKRLRGVLIEAKVEGPAHPVLSFYSEGGDLLAHVPMQETLSSAPFGLVRYRAFFPPVVFRHLARLTLGFSGYRFTLADKMEVRYEGIGRRA